MLANFQKRLMNHSVSSPGDAQNHPQMDDPVAQHRWAITMAETVYVPGCPCPVCARHAESGDGVVSAPNLTRSCSSDHLLPSRRAVIQVLYPPSYLGVYPPFPDPPPYSSNAILPSDGSAPNTLLSRDPPHPLAQSPSITGVPSQGRILPAEPTAALLDHQVEDAETLPTYSRFDQRRPRFPAASDVLGPYPPLPFLSRNAH